MLPAAAGASASAGALDDEAEEVVDLEAISYMALKRLVISKGVPKAEANTVPGKGHLKELAIKHSCKLRFT